MLGITSGKGKWVAGSRSGGIRLLLLLNFILCAYTTYFLEVITLLKICKLLKWRKFRKEEGNETGNKKGQINFTFLLLFLICFQFYF